MLIYHSNLPDALLKRIQDILKESRFCHHTLVSELSENEKADVVMLYGNDLVASNEPVPFNETDQKTLRFGIVDPVSINMPLPLFLKEASLDDFILEPFTDEVLEARLQVLETIFICQQESMEFRVAFLESEAKADAILRETISGIITIDEQGNIESFNPAAENIFGYSSDEVCGMNVAILMPQPYRQEHSSYIHNYLNTGEAKVIGIGREVVGLHKNGTTFPMELAVSEVKLLNRVIFSGIVRDVSARRHLEREILSISEHERRRIGQDLHDGLGQMLTGIGLHVENLRQKLSDQNHAYVDNAEKILHYVEEADTYARMLSRGLVPVQVEANGLATALARLAQQVETMFKVTCHFEAIGHTEAYSSPDAIHLYRIAQEAINNAIKHGKAQHISILLAVGQSQLRLRIQNNGVSFPDKLPEDRGMGLNIIAHRARVLGASFDIRPLYPQGTVVTCTIPLSP